MTARIVIDTEASTTPISPDIYGQYLEHVEDCVDPGMINDHGLREDVIEAAMRLGVPAVRWPGGCFADTYHWADGIGPERPIRPNWHWGNGELEANRFGTHEFLDWCERVGAAPYINTNLGTGSLTEALRWLDYCTGTADTDDTRHRRENGRHRPWTVRYWGIGNETWGHWEAGHSSAEDYAKTLANWADFFHRYDPNAIIVGVGSSEGADPAWDRTVLETAGDHLGLLTLHIYGATLIGAPDQYRAGLAHFPAYVEKRIDAMAALVREHNSTNGRSIGIALDEWNIRHWRPTAGSGYVLDRADPRTGSDALCAAGFFHAMIKNADVVRMANYVFLVNGNGVINARDGACQPTTLFTIFAAYQRWITGSALPTSVSTSSVPTPQLFSGNPDGIVPPTELPETLPAIDAVACRVDGQIRIAMINRSSEAIDVAIAPGTLGASPRTEQFVVDQTNDALINRTAERTADGLRLAPWSITFGAESV